MQKRLSHLSRLTTHGLAMLLGRLRRNQMQQAKQAIVTSLLIVTMLLNSVLPLQAQAVDTTTTPAQPEALAQPEAPAWADAASRVFLPVIMSGNGSINPSIEKVISGVVYHDFNADGARQTEAVAFGQVSERGVGGVIVAAFDSEGRQCGQATTSSTEATLGTYSLTHTCPSATVHVEFSGLPVGFDSAPSGAVGASGTQFVNPTAQNVNYGIYQPANFCQSSPKLAVSSLFSSPDPNASTISSFSVDSLQGKEAADPAGSKPAILSQTVLANQAQVGDVYGLAYQRSTNTLFAGAFVKYSAKPVAASLPNGPGAIYRISTAGAGNELLTVVPEVGALTGADGSISQGDVGTVGLGDLELSEDEQTLYAVNLGGKKLVSIRLNGNPSVAEEIKTDPLPQPSDCATEQTHAFGLKVNNGNVYVGMVCGGPTNNDLKGYVYEFANFTFNKKLGFPLTYQRAANNTLVNPTGNSHHGFTNWSAAPVDASNANALASSAKMAPWLTDIEFDHGDMLLGFRSRWVDQSSDASTTIGGEIVRACGNNANAPTSWTLENNGVCGGRSTQNPPPAIDSWTGGNQAQANSKGPGGFEFYWGDDGYEGEAVQGSLAQLPGSSYVFATQSGALGHGRQVGVMALSHQNGAINAAGNVGAAATGINSVGDMELICDAPPVEIGNRVWKDENADGLQDANEPGIANLGLELYKDENLIATATTDAAGTYYFKSSTGPDANPNDSIGLVDGMINLNLGPALENSGYEIRIPNVAGAIRQAALSDSATVISSGGEQVDMVDGVTAAYALPSGGYTNHNYDFGFATQLMAEGNYCSADLANTVAMMKKYNLIVLDNLSTVSDVEGRTFVGNDITNSNSANFATQLGGVAGASESTLVVAGNILAGNPLNLQAGSLRLKGSRNGRTINYNGGGSLVTDTSISDASMTSQLQAASTGLSLLTANNTAVLASANNNAIKFNVTTLNGCNLAIFNVSAANIFAASQAAQIELSPGSARAIIINVSGTSVNWSNANMVSSFTDATWRGKVIWNFYQATSINFNSRNMMGAVLAPLAAVSTQGNIDGSTAVKSLTTSAEIHRPEFNADLSCACAAATPTPVPTQTFAQQCPNNLVLNPSFESMVSGGTNPTNWLGNARTDATSWIIKPDGVRYGYHYKSDPVMYQDITTTVGSSYSMTFYSASHVPGTQKVQIQYLTSANATVGTAAIHTISEDIDTDSDGSASNPLDAVGKFGGPYTLTLGAAPSNAAKLRITINANGTDWAKVDKMCLRSVAAGATSTPVPATPTRTPTPRPTNTPANVPEVEACTYNLDLTIGQTFNIRDYIHYKDSNAPVDWGQVYFTYTGAGANHPTSPANWNLNNFNNGLPVTVTAADAAAGGNTGTGQFRIYLVRNGQTQYDDHMEIRVSSDPSNDVNEARCSTPPTPTNTPTRTSTATATRTPTNTPPPPPAIALVCSNPNPANVDGNNGEWNLVTDPSVPLYQAARIDKPILGKAYLRYDSYNQILYSLVVPLAGNAIDTQDPSAQFIKLGTQKQVDAAYGDNGTPPDFAYINASGNSAQGWESSIPLAQGTYLNFNLHAQMFDNNVQSQTSAVLDRSVNLTINCPVPTPTNTPVPASIGNRVWEDMDSDGNQDAGEPGITGVSVKLWLETSNDTTPDTLLSTINSGSNGAYSFANLDPSKRYLVQVVPPTGRSFTIKDAVDSSEANDSDIYTATGFSDVTLLAPGQNKEIGAGILPIASIGNRVWDDTDSDGNQDAGEPGVAGVVVKLWVEHTPAITETDKYLIVGMRPSSNGEAVTIGSGNEIGADRSVLTSLNFGAPNNPDPSNLAGTPSNVWPLITYVDGPFGINKNEGSASTLTSRALAPDTLDGLLWDSPVDNGNKTKVRWFRGLPSALDNRASVNGPAIHFLPYPYATGANQARTFRGVDWSGNVAVTSNSGTFSLSDMNVFADTGIESRSTTAPVNISNAYFFQSTLNGVLMDGVEGGGASQPAKGWTGGVNFDPLLSELKGWRNYIRYAATEATFNLDLVNANSKQGAPVINGTTVSGGPYVYTISDAQDLNNDGVIVINVPDTRAGKWEINNSDWVIEGTGNKLVIFRIRGSQNMEVSNSSIMLAGGLAGANNKRLGVLFVKAYPNEEMAGNASGSSDTTFTFSNFVGHGVGMWDLTTIGDANTDSDNVGYNRGSQLNYTKISQSNTQGCSQFIAPFVYMQNVRWVRCVPTTADATVTNLLVTTTDSNGTYSFTNLDPTKRYIVQVVPPTDRNFTRKDAAGSTEATDSDVYTATGYSDVVSLTPNQNKDVGAGLLPVASIGNRVWEDTDSDGIQDAGEPDMTNITVRLWLETNNDNTPDTNILTTTTNISGVYSFINLDPTKRYVVHVTQPDSRKFTLKDAPGSTEATDSDVFTATGYSAVTLLTPNQNSAVGAGILPVASIGNRVWNDLDSDGKQDDGEPGIPGLTVRLWLENTNDNTPDTILDTTTTGSNGAYSFNTLDPTKRYIIQVTPPNGRAFTIKDAPGSTEATDSDVFTATGYSAVTLLMPSQNSEVGAGILPVASIGNRVWEDTDSDGNQDDGEPGLTGVSVRLWLETNNDNTPDTLLDTTSTGSNGAYSFVNLDPTKRYIVQVVSPNGRAFTVKDAAGSTEATDSDINPPTGYSDVTILTPEQNSAVGAGILPVASIGNRVWEDLDADGNQDEGELGLVAITVRLWIENTNDNTPDSNILTTTTGSNGVYQFANLDPTKRYMVQVTPLAGREFTIKDASGVSETTDSDVYTATGYSDVVLLTAGQNAHVGAGILPSTGSIGNRVWEDIDSDGNQDGGEPGVPGVSVKLWIDTDHNDTPDTNILTTTTTVNGEYSFVNLSIGYHYFVQMLAPGRQFTLKDAPSSTEATDSDVYTATGYTDVLLLTEGQRSDVGAGLLPIASIGNRVWEDTDSDGNQDGGEPGISGLTVRLWIDSNNDNTPDSNVMTTTTGSNGAYSFVNLDPTKRYLVEVIPPNGRNFTSKDAAGSTEATDSDINPVSGFSDVTLLAPSQNSDVGAGILPVASIGNRVWEDLDADGNQENGEPGLTGVTVKLWRENNNDTTPDMLVMTTTTGSDGAYSFANLDPTKRYMVEVIEPVGRNFTSKDAVGSTEATDSDINPASGFSDVTLLTPNQNAEVGAGILPLPASIGNRVWEDTDSDGNQDGGEPSIAGVTVRLWLETSNDSTPDTLILTTTTDVNGVYSFVDLDPTKRYIVLVTPPAGRNFTSKDALGSSEATDSDVYTATGLTDVVLLTPGQNSEVGAGILPVSSIGNRVWEDTDSDGNQDAGEPGISGLMVRLWIDSNNDNTPDTLVMTTTTGSNGAYSFVNLDPTKRYSVQVILPNGRNFTAKDAAGSTEATDSDINPGTGFSDVMSLTPSQNSEVGAGILPVASIGNRVWDDLNSDGEQDSGEPSISGLTVRLWIENNNDNTPDSNVLTTTTDNNGVYSFANLDPTKRYIVQVTPPAGRPFTIKDAAGISETHDSDVNPATGFSDVTLLTPNQNAEVGAGILPLASIGNKVWEDMDSDGNRDGGELGIAGITVRLWIENTNDSTPDSNVLTATTDVNGDYSFANLDPSKRYIVQVVPPTGRSFTSKDAAGSTEATDSDVYTATAYTDVTLLTPGQNSEIGAGILPVASIGNRVWDDLDGDGIQEDGEPGITGVTVRLWITASNWLTYALAATTSTGSNGAYSFANLDPTKQYLVEVVAPAGRNFTFKDAMGSSEANDSDVSQANGFSDVITLTPSVNAEVGAGLSPVASIGNRVWHDLDSDGNQDAGEPGVIGITVTLWMEVANSIWQIGQTTTGNDGAYSFANLPVNVLPGVSNRYTIEVTLPAGRSFTSKDAAGSTEATDSDVYTATGRSDVITLTANLNSDVGAGLLPVASIGNRVWEDNDSDGLQDNGEPGISDVTVNLWQGASKVMSTTTSGTGAYSFDNLDPTKQYTVEFVASGGRSFTLKNVGSDELIDSDANSNGFSDAVTLTPGQNSAVGAGILPMASIGGTVWEDADLDGIQDGNELGRAGATVWLWRDNSGTGNPNTQLFTMTTDASGVYTFANLNASILYLVQVDQVPQRIFTTRNAAGSTESNDSDVYANGYSHQIVLVAGQSVVIGAGLIPLSSSIGGPVWDDANADGIQQVTETMMSNVTISLMQHDSGTNANTLLYTTTTNASGVYTFASLPANINYVVHVAQVVDYGFTVKDVAGNTMDTVDSDVQLTGYSDPITVVLDQHTTIAAGMVISSTACVLGDRVWYDFNVNGIQDSGEGNVANVHIDLYNDLTCTSSWVGETNTDGNGYYSFGSLPLGNYCMLFSNIPGNWESSPAGMGGNPALDSEATTVSGGEAILSIAQASMTCQDTGRDLGLHAQGAIAEKVWCEAASSVNGAFNEVDGDTAIADVTLWVYADSDCNGTAEGSALYTETTDLDGNVTFSNLPVAFDENGHPRTCYVVEVDDTDTELNSCNQTASTMSSMFELYTDRDGNGSIYNEGVGFAFTP